MTDAHGKSDRVSRRRFLLRLPAIPLGFGLALSDSGQRLFAAPKAQATLRVAFVKRRVYDFSWPGGAYDGEAARKRYTEQILAAGRELGMQIAMEPQPLHEQAAADRFLAGLQRHPPDGVLLVLLDRHGVAWPTANKLADTGLPAIIFAPVGAAFTTNVLEPSKKPGVYVVSSLDFEAVRYGMRMVNAARQMRETRLVVLKGTKRSDRDVEHLGTKLRTIPVQTFIDELGTIGETAEVRALADDWARRAKEVVEPSRAEMIDAARTYFAARNIMAREDGDAITMDCLGPARRRQMPTPCMAWMKLNDEGTVAACEADLNAALTLLLVRYLFDKPGFQQDPVPETVQNALIGSHCVSPRVLWGPGGPAAPYRIRSHHSGTNVSAQVLWPEGERVTIADFLGPRKLIIYSGTVTGNVNTPPAGGCRTAVTVEVDGVPESPDIQGFHQIFFCGDHAGQLRAYCQMFGIEPVPT